MNLLYGRCLFCGLGEKRRTFGFMRPWRSQRKPKEVLLLWGWRSCFLWCHVATWRCPWTFSFIQFIFRQSELSWGQLDLFWWLFWYIQAASSRLEMVGESQTDVTNLLARHEYPNERCWLEWNLLSRSPLDWPKPALPQEDLDDIQFDIQWYGK